MPSNNNNNNNNNNANVGCVGRFCKRVGRMFSRKKNKDNSNNNRPLRNRSEEEVVFGALKGLAKPLEKAHRKEMNKVLKGHHGAYGHFAGPSIKAATARAINRNPKLRENEDKLKILVGRIGRATGMTKGEIERKYQEGNPTGAPLNPKTGYLGGARRRVNATRKRRN